MSLFCLLLFPALYLWRRSWSRSASVPFPETGLIVGFLIGIAYAVLRFAAFPSVPLRGFGSSAFVSQLIDGAPLDALLPVAVYAALRHFGSRRQAFDPHEASRFVLGWLFPLCALRAVVSSAVPDPVVLVAVPLLQASLAFSFPFWVWRVIDLYGWGRVGALSAVAALPFLSAAASWFLLTGRFAFGALCLLSVLSAAIPPFISARRRSSSAQRQPAEAN